MGSNTPDFIDYILEMLAPLDALSIRPLFGGHSLKSQEVPFALIINNIVYFSVDDTTRPHYEAQNMECFSYHKQGKEIFVRKYYQIPDGCFEDQDILITWAEEAIAAAIRTRSS